MNEEAGRVEERVDVRHQQDPPAQRRVVALRRRTRGAGLPLLAPPLALDLVELLAEPLVVLLLRRHV